MGSSQFKDVQHRSQQSPSINGGLTILRWHVVELSSVLPVPPIHIRGAFQRLPIRRWTRDPQLLRSQRRSHLHGRSFQSILRTTSHSKLQSCLWRWAVCQSWSAPIRPCQCQVWSWTAFGMVPFQPRSKMLYTLHIINTYYIIPVLYLIYYKYPPLDFHCKMRGLVFSKKWVSWVIL